TQDAEQVQVAQRSDDEAVVGEDRLPRERADQVRDEEGRDDQQEEKVLPPAAAEGDPVGDRIADQERDRRREPGVLERAEELRLVVANRVPVVPPGPGERVAELDRPGLERLVSEKPERDEKENSQPEHTGRKEQVRRKPAMTMEKPHS